MSRRVPKVAPRGSHIDDYVVEDHADHVLAIFKTQDEAIKWAKDNGHKPGYAAGLAREEITSMGTTKEDYPRAPKIAVPPQDTAVACHVAL